MGFDVAFGLTMYDDSPDSIEDEDIGRLIPYFIGWGVNKDY